MPRLIDLEKIKPIDFPSTEMDGLDVVQYLNTIPTVDAVEVVHGRWFWKDGCFHCSNCKTSNDHTLAYCGGCGAKMDGDGNG